MENLIECKISKEDLKALHEKLCVDPDTEDKFCDKCILGNIQTTDLKKCWPAQEGDENKASRSLCFAIWHDDILSDNPVHNHH